MISGLHSTSLEQIFLNSAEYLASKQNKSLSNPNNCRYKNVSDLKHTIDRGIKVIQETIIFINN